MSNSIHAAVGAGALFSLFGPPAAHAGTYAYTAVPAPSYVVNSNFYYVAGINDSGEFVAGGSDVNDNQVAFAWNNGTYTQITYNGAVENTGVGAINDAGVAAAAGYFVYTFDIKTGVATKVKKLRKGAGASSINTAGELAGNAPYKGKGEVFYTQGKKHVPAFYAVPGADATAVSIDDSNTVYGLYRAFSGNNYDSHGLIISGGVATEFDAPGATSTYVANGRDGTVYGDYVVNNTGPAIGYTLTNGSYTTYQCPSGGSALMATVAMAAVAGGGIAAQCYYQSNPTQGYVAFGTHFYPILPPGAVKATLAAISPDGTKLAGIYSDGTTTYFYTAACASNQVPCTQ